MAGTTILLVSILAFDGPAASAALFGIAVGVSLIIVIVEYLRRMATREKDNQ